MLSLAEFREEMLSEIRNEAAINYSDITTEFLKYYTDYLLNAEEILEFDGYDIEVVGTKNRKARVDGFSFDQLDRSISLYIADFDNDDEMGNLTNTDIETYKNRALAFLDFVYSGYITDNCEESSAACQLAKEILGKNESIFNVKIVILTDSSLSRAVKNIKIDDYDNKHVELVIWDINRIYNLYSSSLQREDLNINLDDFDIKDIPCIEAISDEKGKYTSYLAVISGKLLSDLYIKYGTRLLEGNVRSFLSVRGKINKGIRNTIRNEPDIFFVYNNGIACTATDAEVVSTNEGMKIKKLTNFQIINGGQTTASIANAILQDKAYENVNKIKVLMKLTVLHVDAIDEDDLKGDEFTDPNLTLDQKKAMFTDKMTESIARYANSQNKVDESDFFSNHPYHVRFEQLSRKNYAPPVGGSPYQTIWYYERAKGQYTQEQMKLTRAEKRRFEQKNPKKQVIKKTDLAKYLMTYYQRPNIVSRGNQYNMRFFADEINKEWKADKDKSSFNSYYYKKCIALAILFKKTETLVSQASWYQKAFRSNIVTYALSSLFYMIDSKYKKYELDFIRVWNNQGLYEELENQIKDLTFFVNGCITNIDSSITSNVSEWCKKPACWDRIKKSIDQGEFNLNDNFINTFIDKDIAKNEKKNEKKDQKETDNINNQIKVINLGEDYWKSALQYGINMKILNDREISLLKAATNFQKIPSEKQCPLILEIREKLIEEGFMDTQVKLKLK